MTLVVGGSIDVDLDDADAGFAQVLLDPVGGDEGLRPRIAALGDLRGNFNSGRHDNLRQRVGGIANRTLV